MGVFKQKYLNYFLMALTHLAIILPFKSAHAKDAKNNPVVLPNNVTQIKIPKQNKTPVPVAVDTKNNQKLTQQNMDFILARAYFPLLKQNEGERLYFYRCSARKVTAGYGSNVQDNPNFLNSVEIYYNKKALTKDEKNYFVRMCKTLSDAELAKYTITKKDAEKMAYLSMGQAIQSLRKIPSWHFDTLPLISKILLLDIRLNVGPDRLQKFRRFKKALLTNNWAKVASECTVFFENPTTKKTETNPRRESRKQMICSLAALVKSSTSTTAVFDALNKQKLSKLQKNLLTDENERAAFEAIVYFALLEKSTLARTETPFQNLPISPNITK